MDEINLNEFGYRWIGSNRIQTHIQAPKGSGGVGFFIKCDLYNSYNVKVIDHAYEGIIGVHFVNKFADFNFIVYSLYLPPENSPWGRNATAFSPIYLPRCIYIVKLTLSFYAGI